MFPPSRPTSGKKCYKKPTPPTPSLLAQQSVFAPSEPTSTGTKLQSLPLTGLAQLLVSAVVVVPDLVHVAMSVAQTEAIHDLV